MEAEADSARLRERRSMTGLVLRRAAKGPSLWRREVSLSEEGGEEVGWWLGKGASGSSMRKETEARISANVEGFLKERVRRDDDGRRFPVSGAASSRGRLRLEWAVVAWCRS